MLFYLVICVILGVLFGGAYYAYRIAFFSPKKGRDEIPTVSGPSYDPYKEEIKRVFLQLQNTPSEAVCVSSHDGLILSGRYYHVKDGSPVAICFHGYRSSGLTDFCGGSELCFQTEQNVLLVDQRAHGKSQGNTITFGIKERRDLIQWVQYTIGRFGPDVEILLYGISMGGATVLMASELELLKNVKAIIADCPYASPMEIILHVGKTYPIPKWLMKPFVILGARIFGGFDILEANATDAVKKAKIPILIIHGEADRFVPWEMSKCVALANPKMVSYHTFPGADHGISYLVDGQRYRQVVTEFLKQVL